VNVIQTFAAMFVLTIMISSATAQGKKPSAASKKAEKSVSFKDDVFPKIIKKHCLPCHAEDEFNPSELYLDSYELLKAGGKHGPPWVAGNSKESLLIQKLGPKPPFEDRMPLNDKKKIAAGKAKYLTDEEIKMISDWIDQGAKDN
jgi:uncharacterized membrane protein